MVEAIKNAGQLGTFFPDIYGQIESGKNISKVQLTRVEAISETLAGLRPRSKSLDIFLQKVRVTANQQLFRSFSNKLSEQTEESLQPEYFHTRGLDGNAISYALLENILTVRQEPK